MAEWEQRARQLLEIALHDAAGTEWSVLIGPQGAIHLIADSGWPLDSLAREHGAQAAYRITRRNGRVRVEARQGARNCVLEASLGSAPPLV
jgi:hypothetical protein